MNGTPNLVSQLIVFFFQANAPIPVDRRIVPRYSPPRLAPHPTEELPVKRNFILCLGGVFLVLVALCEVPWHAITKDLLGSWKAELISVQDAEVHQAEPPEALQADQEKEPVLKVKLKTLVQLRQCLQTIRVNIKGKTPRLPQTKSTESPAAFPVTPQDKVDGSRPGPS